MRPAHCQSRLCWSAKLVLLILGVSSVAVCFHRTAEAQQAGASSDTSSTSGVTIEQVSIGFGNGGEAGRCKVGMWSPVNVTLRGKSSSSVTGALELESIDGDGFPSIVTSGVLTIPTGTTVRQQLLVRPGSQGGTLTIRFRESESGQVLVERTTDMVAMLSTQKLWVELGADLRTQEAAGSISTEEDESIEVARIEDLELLPTQWFGYESVDVLFVSVDDISLRGQLRGNARLEALEGWVKSGGRLVLAVGAESAQSTSFFEPSGQPHPLLRFVPGTFDGMSQVTQTNELQRLADATDRFDAGISFQVPSISPDPGAVVHSRFPNGTPIVLEKPYGFGRVTFVPLDWHLRPFSNWGARGRFIKVALGMLASDVPVQTDENGGQLSHSGMTDMAAQLRSGLDLFPDVSIVPFWAIALAIAGYIVLIGPLDYFLIKRVLRSKGQSRMEFTWITFPLWVVLVSGAAFWFAHRSKGNNLHVNQLIVEDYDMQSGTVRGTCWASVFSPSMETYDISRRQLEGASAGRDPLPAAKLTTTSWMGLPGAALGGMATDDTLVLGRHAAYNYERGYSQLSSTPIPVWSSRSFTSRWLDQNESPPLEFNVTLVSGDILSGEIRNTSKKDLTNCLIAFGRWAYPVGSLEAGRSIRLSSHAKKRRELRDELNDREMKYDEETKQFHSEHKAYEVLSRDIGEIARMMSLYDAAGGKDYTSLNHHYQAFMDLTPMIELNRGVLIGFVEQPEPVMQVQAESAIDPQEKAWKCLRFVFDVPKE
ncbi:MAG: hypothetical protein MPJ50_00910 [Pirellulales bacterium]|nr:hypothetical protein [Pirellulales bacterium]